VEIASSMRNWIPYATIQCSLRTEYIASQFVKIVRLVYGTEQNNKKSGADFFSLRFLFTKFYLLTILQVPFLPVMFSM
jgi:hypothetical protein